MIPGSNCHTRRRGEREGDTVSPFMSDRDERPRCSDWLRFRRLRCVLIRECGHDWRPGRAMRFPNRFGCNKFNYRVLLPGLSNASGSVHSTFTIHHKRRPVSLLVSGEWSSDGRQGRLRVRPLTGPQLAVIVPSFTPAAWAIRSSDPGACRAFAGIPVWASTGPS